MADKTQVILDVQVDGVQAVKEIDRLNGEIAKIREEQSKLNLETEEGRKTSIAYDEQVKSLKKEMQGYSKAIQDSVKENENAVGSYNALSAQLAQLKRAYKAAASDEERNAILKNLVKVDERLKELDEKQGVYVRNVGNYKGAILGAFSAMPGPIGNAANAAKGFGGALKVISTTPVIGILQLLLPLILKLVSAFKGNAAAMEAVNKAFAAFDGVGVIVNKVIDKIAEGVTWLADKLGKFAEKIGLVSSEMKESNRITQEELALEEKRRTAIVKNAQAEQDIAKLKADAADKYKLTIDQRIAAYRKAGQLEEEIMQRNYEIAQREYELIKAKNAQSNSSIEDMRKEAEAEAAMIQAKTRLYQKQKEINSQISAMRKEGEAESAKATAAEEKRTKTEEKNLSNRQKLQKSELDLEIAKYETEAGIVGKYTQASYDRHIKYYDDLAALYEKDSAEYNAALAAKEKYQQDFNKNVEARAQQHDSILDKYGLIAPGQNDLTQQLKSLQDALNSGIIAEEEYAQAVAEVYARIAMNRAASVVDMGKQIMDITSTIAGAVEEQENAEMERYMADNEAKKEALQDRLDAGLITQAEYDNQVASLDKEQEKKKKELDLKQAKRQKAMAIMNATLNAAAAIIASLAQSPVAIGPIPNPAGIASLALATATGVAQIAAAAATPLPQAGKGMLITGPSHAEGGVLINAEGGEAIINKKATSRYLPYLSRINQSTGGVALYGRGGLVGQPQIDRAQSEVNIADTLAQTPIYVAVTDINRGQDNMAKVVERKSY